MAIAVSAACGLSYLGYKLSFELQPNMERYSPVPAVTCFIFGFLLFGTAIFILVPEWRDAFAGGLGRIRVVLPGGSKIGTGYDDRRRIETPAPKSDKATETKVESLATRIDEDTDKELAEAGDAAVLWNLAIKKIEQDDYGTAHRIINVALRKYATNPKLWITAGYLWSRRDDLSQAIESAEQAIVSATNRDDFREQYFVAHSNLCYYLTLRGKARDKEKALRSGRLASDHANEFEDRDSFKLNFGFALVQYGENEHALIEAIKYLGDIEPGDLSQSERDERQEYLSAALGKLKALS